MMSLLGIVVVAIGLAAPLNPVLLLTAAALVTGLQVKAPTALIVLAADVALLYPLAFR